MYDGLLPVWKAAGMTSHDVVFKARKILGMKKIGHTGTLDPAVEGVLLLCLGKGTKLVELLMDGEKVYQGEVTFGVSTETEDAEGTVVEEQPVETAIPDETIDQAMHELTGVITQIPPMYSAVKVKGRRLYEYARAGEVVERPERQVNIDRFERMQPSIYDEQSKMQRTAFMVHCGKGTYVRTLAVDLGRKLGYPAHMSQLIRLSTGGFGKEDAVSLEELAEAVQTGAELPWIQPIETGLKHLPRLDIQGEALIKVRNGQVLEEDYFGATIKEATVLYNDGHAIAIYAPHPSKADLIKPQKMF